MNMATPWRCGISFTDKPVILVLAYYECPNLCTLVLNGVLQTAQDLKFDAGREYEIVVVSFDPRERPALAAAKKQIYIKRYGRARGGRWLAFSHGRQKRDRAPRAECWLSLRL